MSKRKAFTTQAREFFGVLPGQGLKAFREELARLDFSERMEIARELAAAGLPVDYRSVSAESITMPGGHHSQGAQRAAVASP